MKSNKNITDTAGCQNSHMYIIYTSNGVKFGVNQNVRLQYSMAGLYSKPTLNVTHVI